MEEESSPTRGESLSGLVYSDSYSGVFENEEQQRTISEALARMADDPSNLPSFITEVIEDAVAANPNKGIYVLNENNPFSVGEITDQFTGNTLKEDTTDKNIILLWDKPNQRISYITTEEGTPTTISQNINNLKDYQTDEWLQNIEYGQHIRNLQEQIASSSGNAKEKFQETLNALLENPPPLSLSKREGTSFRTYPAGTTWLQPDTTLRSITDTTTFKGLTWASTVDEIKTHLENLISNPETSDLVLQDAQARLSQLNNYIDNQ